MVTAIAVFSMAATASAGTITYSTNAAGTEFVSPMNGLTLDSSSGLTATLTFEPDADIAIGVPSNINFGIFTLACAECSTEETESAFFAAFTFDLVITDESDGATGEFVGASAGGTVASNSSTITVHWSPVVLGPGSTGAMTGDFNLTGFEITSPSRIVAPNSGANVGETTVQGDINSGDVIRQVPEAGTFTMIGAALIGLGLLRRRRLFGK
jgi:hypothetical protein